MITGFSSSLGLILGGAGFIMLVLMLVIRDRGVALAREQKKAEMLRKVMEACGVGANVKVTADNILVAVMDMVPAKGYYFYTRASQANELVLTASRTERGPASFGPSYSGLAEYSGTPEYTAPLTLPAANLPKKADIVSEAAMDFVVVPFGRQSVTGLMKIGPLRKKTPGQTILNILTEAGAVGGGIISALADKATLEDKTRSLQAMARASDAAAASALGGRQFIETFLGLGAKLVGAPAGALILLSSDGSKIVHTALGLSGEEECEIRRNPDLCYAYARVPDQPSMASLQDNPAATALRHLKPKSAVYFPISSEALLAYWLVSPVSLARYALAAVQSVAARIGDALRNERIYREMSRGYLQSLRSIVSAIDSVETYTVTHSTLIARYARGIAQEMGLSALDTIETAAYLHDVGMSVLNERIMFKKGRYEKDEYEEMKSHAEMGASLVGSIMEPPGLGEIIRHHHERWDGWGYPYGLKGEEIPVGARIVAVADTFNAKVSSRNYRTGLAFDRALEDIRVAAGSQFDPAVVTAFFSWWGKQQARARADRPLEHCTVMKGCPESISSQCPCSAPTAVCWLTPGNKCEMHGDICVNCIVRTEWEARNRPKQLSITDL